MVIHYSGKSCSNRHYEVPAPCLLIPGTENSQVKARFSSYGVEVPDKSTGRTKSGFFWREPDNQLSEPRPEEYQASVSAAKFRTQKSDLGDRGESSSPALYVRLFRFADQLNES